MIKAAETAFTRAVAYLRMSTDEQTLSIPDQMKKILAYCAKHGIKLIRTYEDPGISGDQWDRPQFQQLLHDCDHRKDFDILLIWDSSRFSRLKMAKAQRAYGTVLDSARIIVVDTEEEIDPDNLVHFIMMAINSHGDNKKVRDTSRDITRRHEVLISEGRWARGGIPYGYRLDLTQRTGRKSKRLGTGKLLPIPEQLEHVRIIFRKYATTDISLTKLALWVNQHLPTKEGGWSPNGLAFMLRNQVYLGHYRSGMTTTGKYHMIVGGEMVDSKTPGIETYFRRKPEDAHFVYNTHEAAVDQALFQAVQERLAMRKMSHSKSEGFELTGLIRCAHCGGPMRGHKMNDHGTIRRYYTCPTRRENVKRVGRKPYKYQTTPMCGIYIPCDDLLETVRERVLARFLSDAALETYRERVEAYLAVRYGQAGTMLEGIEKQIASNEKECKRYLALLGQTDDLDMIAEYQRALKVAKDKQRELSRTKETESHLNKVGASAIAGDTCKIIEKLREIRKSVAKCKTRDEMRLALSQVVDRIEITSAQHPTVSRKKVVAMVDIVPRNAPVNLPGSPSNGVGIGDVINSAPAHQYTNLCAKTEDIWPASIKCHFPLGN